MKPREYIEPMEMPTPCGSCGRWQELNDMYPSQRWYKGIVICEECYNLEEEEIGLEDDITGYNEQIADAEYIIKENKEAVEMAIKQQKELQEKIDKYRHS